MPFKQLQDMLDAYRRTIGAPYSRWQIADVLRLLDHCFCASQTWQREMRDATGVSSSKANRFVDAAVGQGWIERPTSRTADAKKPLHMTAKGRRVVAEFERLCREAVRKNRREVSQEATGEAIPQSRVAPANRGKTPTRAAGKSGYLSPDLAPAGTKMPDASRKTR
jgi:DNA-binding MarR family transcriptional regulator